MEGADKTGEDRKRHGWKDFSNVKEFGFYHKDYGR